jgi:molecular chaperone HscB
VATYFELFDLPLSFRVDRAALDARYRALSQLNHPDKFAGAAPRERLKSLEATSEINAGYRTLGDPMARGTYLLKLLGIDLDREDTHAHAMDPAFLMDILERREALDGAVQARDLEQALALGRQIAEQEKATLQELEGLFDAQAATPSPERLTRIADRVAALRYFRRFQDEVAKLDEEMDS